MHGGLSEIGDGDEHRVMSGSAESLYCTPNTYRTLYANFTRIFFKSKLLNVFHLIILYS